MARQFRDFLPLHHVVLFLPFAQPAAPPSRFFKPFPCLHALFFSWYMGCRASGFVFLFYADPKFFFQPPKAPFHNCFPPRRRGIIVGCFLVLSSRQSILARFVPPPPAIGPFPLHNVDAPLVSSGLHRRSPAPTLRTAPGLKLFFFFSDRAGTLFVFHVFLGSTPSPLQTFSTK